MMSAHKQSRNRVYACSLKKGFSTYAGIYSSASDPTASRIQMRPLWSSVIVLLVAVYTTPIVAQVSYMTSCTMTTICLGTTYTMLVSETFRTFKSQAGATYGTSTNYFQAVAPPGPGYRIRVAFTLFATEGCCDMVYLYRGITGPFRTSTVTPPAAGTGNTIYGPVGGTVVPTLSYFSFWGEPIVASLYSEVSVVAAGITIVAYLEACPAGSFCTTGSSTITACLSGTYNPSAGASAISACLPCPIGSHCPTSGMSAPVPCPCPAGCLTTGLITAPTCTFGTSPSQTPSASVSATRTQAPLAYWTSCAYTTQCPFTPYTMLLSETSRTFKTQSAASYALSTNYFQAIAPPGPGYCIRVAFTQCATEAGFDFVYLYRGITGPFKTLTVLPP